MQSQLIKYSKYLLVVLAAICLTGCARINRGFASIKRYSIESYQGPLIFHDQSTPSTAAQ